jgi:bifunctional non-homologous end joining protein LigD
MLRPSSQPAAFIEPCLPRPAKQPPTGRGWIHEIKHDGFRILAQRADGRVRLRTRKGTDFSSRFPQIVAALTVLPVRSCLIDGEAIVYDENGLAVCDLIRQYRHDAAAVLCAFDLLDLDGQDLRRTPIETRKLTLSRCCAPNTGASCSTSTSPPTARSSTTKLAHLAARGIVSKRLGSYYRSGRADCWVKVKNPAAPAVRREAEEKWN